MATRGRSARAAVLASSVQRSKPTPYPSKIRSAFTRRVVLAVLVLLALTLLTISFRSPTSGALHDLQGAGSSALRPFQVAATRVAQPFKDAYDYLDSLANAKSENAKLRKEVAQYRSDLAYHMYIVQKYPQLARLLHYQEGATFPKGYRAVNARVISFSASPFTHSVEVAAGSSSGLSVTTPTPVVNGEGLVGIVSNVASDTAVVKLLSDPNSYVAALDLRTGVRGVVHTGPGGTLILDYVNKQYKVSNGDMLVTLGTKNPRYPDLYPAGIPIGKAANVNVTDTASYLQVQVQPFANLSSLDSVAALVKTTKGK